MTEAQKLGAVALALETFNGIAPTLSASRKRPVYVDSVGLYDARTQTLLAVAVVVGDCYTWQEECWRDQAERAHVGRRTGRSTHATPLLALRAACDTLGYRLGSFAS